MENIVIGNATYLVSRVFIGNQNVSELIQKRVEENRSQVLPLTNSVSASYNNSGRDAGERRNHAYKYSTLFQYQRSLPFLPQCKLWHG